MLKVLPKGRRKINLLKMKIESWTCGHTKIRRQEMIICTNKVNWNQLRIREGKGNQVVEKCFASIHKSDSDFIRAC